MDRTVMTEVKTEKRTIIKRIIAVGLMVFMVAGYVHLASKYYLRGMDNAVVRLDGFYEEDDNSLDVIILGSSEIYQGFSSADAYGQYGFTGYPFAFETNPVSLWKYEVKEILKSQSPQLIVVEINGVVYDEKLLHKPSAIRYLSDAMPFSQNKVDLVENMGIDSAISYYFPIVKYHENIRVRDIRPLVRLTTEGHLTLRGAFSHSFIKEMGEEMELKGGETIDLHPEAEEYLREFLDICGEPGMPNFLFVRFPHQTVDEKTFNRYARYNRAAEIIKEYGFEYVDLDTHREEIGLIKDADWYDGEHLNARGMKKLTKFFGNMLVEEYGVQKSKLTPKQEEEWDESARYMNIFYEYFETFYEENHEKKEEGNNMWDNIHTIKAIKNLLVEG